MSNASNVQPHTSSSGSSTQRSNNVATDVASSSLSRKNDAKKKTTSATMPASISPYTAAMGHLTTSAPYEGPTGSTSVFLQNPEKDEEEEADVTPVDIMGDTRPSATVAASNSNTANRTTAATAPPAHQHHAPAHVVVGAVPHYYPYNPQHQHATPHLHVEESHYHNSSTGRGKSPPKQHHSENEEWNRRHQNEPFNYLHQQQPYILDHHPIMSNQHDVHHNHHNQEDLSAAHTALDQQQQRQQLAIAIPALVSFLLLLSTLISSIGLILMLVVMMQQGSIKKLQTVFAMLYRHLWVYVLTVVASVGLFGISFMTTIWTAIAAYYNNYYHRANGANGEIARQRHHHHHHHHHYYDSASTVTVPQHQQQYENLLLSGNNQHGSNYYPENQHFSGASHHHNHKYRHPMNSFMFWWQLVLMVFLVASVAGLIVCTIVIVKDDLHWSNKLMQPCKDIEKVVATVTVCSEINASLKLLVAGTIFTLVCTVLLLLWNTTCLVLHLVGHRRKGGRRRNSPIALTKVPRQGIHNNESNPLLVPSNATAQQQVNPATKPRAGNAAAKGIKRYGTVLAD